MEKPETKKKVVHVLLVEDNPADAALISTLIKTWENPFRISHVTDGEAAVNFLMSVGSGENTQPDLILLDLNLPKIDGREVLKEIKSHPIFRRIPVLVLSTSNADDAVCSSYANYANAYITKPCDLSSFSQAIKDIEAFWINTAERPRFKQGLASEV